MKTIISWFVNNHVASNLLVLFVVIGGIVTFFNIKMEIFPETELDKISISVTYEGASPEEIEDSIILPIEEAISGLSGIKEISATANEGYGVVVVDVINGWDVSKLLDDIKSQVDAITTFPEKADRPIVRQLTIKNKVVYIAVYGNTDMQTLKYTAEKIRDDITALKGLSLAEIYGAKDNEIHIEISQDTLEKYNLSIPEIAKIIRNYSLDIPAGHIKSSTEDILIRTKGKRYYTREFKFIPIITKPDGSVVYLKDIANIKESFDDSDLEFKFQGMPAVLVEVFRIGDQNVLEVSSKVTKYIEHIRNSLPPNVYITKFEDQSRILKDRMRLLFKNLGIGLILVILILGIFLEARLAIWVSAGIPIAFMGALVLLPKFDVSINMISLFGFIMVLGIVVDDAIIIGENIYTKRQQGLSPFKAAIYGANEVGIAVIFSVLTTVAAFWPLLLGTGHMGKFMRNIPIVVNLVLIASLIEAIFILPCHLYESTKKHIQPKEKRADKVLKKIINGPYKTMLIKCVRYRYISMAIGLVILLIFFGIWYGNIIKFTFFPKVEGETMICSVTLPPGTPVSYTEKILEKIKDAGLKTIKEAENNRDPNKPPLLKYVLTIVGTQISIRGHVESSNGLGGNKGQILMQLLEAEKREISTKYLVSKWRKEVGQIPGVESLTFSGELFSFGSPIAINLSSPNYEQLKRAVSDLKKELSKINGVFDIDDSYLPGKREIKVFLKPQGKSLGLSVSDIASQVRGAFFGSEAYRFVRNKDEVKVKVRYPEWEKNVLISLKGMKIKTPAGFFVPIGEIADFKVSRGYSSISRQDRKRIITVYADVDENIANASEIRKFVVKTILPKLMAKYNDLYFSMEGEGKEQQESFHDILKGFIIAMFAIYTLLAIPLRSFTQPFIIMLAIPFSFVGAIIGHMIMGLNLTILSMFGMVGLAGVAVNDSLVLTDAANSLSGDPEKRAVKAGMLRFRAVLLTSLTTFFGLVPMIMEKSIQAKFLIPMAISLGFGILFATFITLFLTPCSYVILHDILKKLSFSKAKSN